jgi:hypothetical protein
VLSAAGVRISMDGRRPMIDNMFIERLWRSVKHEDVYLKGYADGREAHIGKHHPSSSGARPSLANDGLARRYIREHGRGYDAALGQRCRVAHMPIAATATTTVRSLIW